MSRPIPREHMLQVALVRWCREAIATPHTLLLVQEPADEAADRRALKADLHANEQVDLSMWAVRASVLELARTGADQLRQNLQDAGLSMRSFQAIAGPRPNDPSPVKPLARPGEVLDFRV